MMTQVISVVQEKGGAGKTTLLTAIASLMVEDGAKVAVIDTDPQRHLEAWAKKEQTSLDWLYEENDEKLLPTVKTLKKNDPAYDVIFIDTAGFKSAMAMHAIAAANLILIPSKANEADAKGARRTFSHVQSVAETMERDIPALVVMMDVDTHTNITQAITDAFDAQSVPRLDAMCAHRTGFKEMTSTGKAPQGSARMSAKSVLADLQRRGLVNFYRSGSWPKSA
jgi:chromosome partitioning protein|tara:strand:+ start:1789 stop:2460 length:672 start_codon:yes stop_codon:yes gene_type:complete